jgi:hypothetical protein
VVFLSLYYGKSLLFRTSQLLLGPSMIKLLKERPSKKCCVFFSGVFYSFSGIFYSFSGVFYSFISIFYFYSGVFYLWVVFTILLVVFSILLVVFSILLVVFSIFNSDVPNTQAVFMYSFSITAIYEESSSQHCVLGTLLLSQCISLAKVSCHTVYLVVHQQVWLWSIFKTSKGHQISQAQYNCMCFLCTVELERALLYCIVMYYCITVYCIAHCQTVLYLLATSTNVEYNPNM